MASRILTILAGLWLMISPTVFQFDKQMSDNNYIIGPIIMSFSIIALWECTRNVRFPNLLCGAWLLIAPWILSYTNWIAIINDSVIGIVVILLTLPEQKRKDTFGGGWISIFK